MPSPRSSPAIRPSSPLSPAYKPSHFEGLQPPSPRTMHSRTGSKQRRPPTNSLKLPSLPRFHPANFPSSHNSSVQTTPDGQTPGQPPVSPRAHSRMYSNDAQTRLYFNQREMFTSSTRGPAQGSKPTGPRLEPLGSPGPVTPLELEGDEGYLMAGVRMSSKDSKGNANEVVEKFIREEARRERESSR